MLKLHRKSRGHTLFELMISSALVGICLLGVLALVQAGTRYLRITDAKTGLQGGALLMMHQLAIEFSETNDVSFATGYDPANNDPPGQICRSCGAGALTGTFVENTEPPTSAGTDDAASNTPNCSGVSFASPRSPVSGDISYDAAGRMFWPKHVCYYWKKVKGVPCVVREVVSIAEPTCYPPGPRGLPGFVAASLPSKIMARNVTCFHCVKAASCLQVHLRVDLPSGYGKRYGFEVLSQVFTRN